MTNRSISSSIYQRLALRCDGLSIQDLTTTYDLSKEDVLACIQTLEKRGLVKFDGLVVRPVLWWNEKHLEIFLDVPLVSEDTFQRYCDEIDVLCNELRTEGLEALRPYTHETTLEIILGVTAGFALVEFTREFLGELGKKFADFVERVIQKYRNEGITEVEIKGVRKSRGDITFTFSVKGFDTESVIERFTNLTQSLEEAIHKLERQDELLLSGDGWKIVLRKVNQRESMIKEIPASNKSIESNLMNKLKIILKAELSELNYPYEGNHRKTIIPIDADLILKIAQELAEALIYLGAIGGGLITIKKVLHKVKSIFNPNKNTRAVESVLLFLIKRFEESGSGATVNELSSAIHRSKSSIRKALHTLQSKGLAYKTQNRFAGSYVWYYTRPKALMQNEMEGSK